MSGRRGARLHHYTGGSKANIVGSRGIGTAGHPAPAWRVGNSGTANGAAGGTSAAGARQSDPGGKILLTNLPPDVGEEEIIVRVIFVQGISFVDILC